MGDAVLRSRLVIALAVVAVGLVLFPGVDLTVSGWFYAPDIERFPIGRQDWAQTVHELIQWSARIGAIVMLVAAIATGILNKRLLGLRWVHWIYLLAALLIGPGFVANVIFKDSWDRARPVQVQEFGGDQVFTPALVPADQCGHNCSFVSGDATVGFFLLAFAFVYPHRRRFWLAAGIGAGMAAGMLRVAMGAHFFSDVIYAGIVVGLVSWAVYAGAVRIRRAFPPQVLRSRLARLRAVGQTSAPTIDEKALIDRTRATAARTGLPTWAWALIGLFAVAVLIDTPIYRVMSTLDPPLRRTLGSLTFLGDSSYYLVISVLTMIGAGLASTLLRHGRWKGFLAWTAWAASFVFASVAISGIIVNIIKQIVGRARPALHYVEGLFSVSPFAFDGIYTSFPSGHANTIFALALALGFLVPRLRKPLIVLAVVVASTRVIISAHYVSDIIGGALLAGITTYWLRGWYAGRRLVFERTETDEIRLRAPRLRAWIGAGLAWADPLRFAGAVRHWITAVWRLLTTGSSRRSRKPLMLPAPAGSVTPPSDAASPAGIKETVLWPKTSPALPISPIDATAVPALSVVVPVKDEGANIEPLLQEIATALADGPAFEAVYVDDGSGDDTPDALTRAGALYPWLKVVRHQQSCGQSAAIRTGVLNASGRLIVTLDGDGQNDPADIPGAVRTFLTTDLAVPLGMIAGQRHKRQDSETKQWASHLGNGIRSRLLGDKTPDTGCGLKVFRRDAFMLLPYFDHMHRFLPALMLREGFAVKLYPVAHRPRTRGTSKYGVLDRALVGVVDLLGVMWLQRRRRAARVSRND